MDALPNLLLTSNNVFDVLILCFISFYSFLVADTLHKYSKDGDIFSFFPKYFTKFYEFIFRTNKHRSEFSFIQKAILICTSCFSGWIGIFYCLTHNVVLGVRFGLLDIIFVSFLSMYLTRKIA
jgi:hypothetical protein